ncbi:protein NAR1-like isoform X1 [Papaver somniferum]|uniref:protein NAR1-like isoform X1 n=1 Tax=Papaver somniferum TaxID=3469 RepID=UPI000E6F9CB7|nr:protein NAR1-like isoform X1 [Papaver somniferum]
MSAKFSPTLQISDLNDYIAPSQACIVSLKGTTTAKKQETAQVNQVVISPSVKQLNTEPVKISLKDCLACSGCITSAETVMLEKQSLEEFLTNIKDGKDVIVSLSPQSRASLATHFGLSPSQVFGKLTTFLKSLGVKAVFDTSCSRDLSLIESCNEFVARYKQKQSLPMISSACPGWICYSEKTLGSYILPYISSVKSPQQTMGATIKNHICQRMGFRPENVYHVTIMMCYDKKLEASRDDFLFPLDSNGETRNEAENPMVAEVDSVLTSGEVLELIQRNSVDFKALADSPLDRLLTNVDEHGRLYGVSGGSGGYADTIYRHAAKVLTGKEIEGPLHFEPKRKNSDFCELNLDVEVEGEKIVLKFALCYGFRNLQNVVRQIKMGKCDYHYLEIMACPSGCLNGGGQIKPKEGQSGKELIQALESAYMENVVVTSPFENLLVKRLYDEWLEQPGSEKAKKHMHTQYHPMVKNITSQLHNW